MKQMLDAGVHFGHRPRFWNPKMKPYIFGTRRRVHIINLETTLDKFQEATDFAYKFTKEGKKILFVGTKRVARAALKKEAERCGMPYAAHRWLGGMMTNFTTIEASIRRLKDLEFLAAENFEQFDKKEALMMTREIEKLQYDLGGIKDLETIPDAIFVIDVGYEKNAVNEAKKLRIPIIGVVDTNHNPEGIDYVIPGNDDSFQAVQLYIEKMADTILKAKEEREAQQEEQKFTPTPSVQLKNPKKETPEPPDTITTVPEVQATTTEAPKTEDTTTETTSATKPENDHEQPAPKLS